MTFIQNIFSIRNEQGKNKMVHKVITILGMKFKFLKKINTVQEKIGFKDKNFIPQPALHLAEFHIAEHCNLNCKSCVHFSPLAEKEFLDIDTFKKDVKRLFELSNGNVDYINVMGGEPLLNPNVLEYLRFARNLFTKSTIQLVTNGILLKEQNDNFWREIAENKITIAVTKYPINVDFDNLSQKAKNIGAIIKYFSADKKKSQWHFPVDISGKQSKIENFRLCTNANKCTNIYKGKLYICPIASNMHHFNKFFNLNIPIGKDDYIDLYKAESIEDILLFISKPTPLCKYCDIKNRTFNHDWGITKRDIKEWT